MPLVVACPQSAKLRRCLCARGGVNQGLCWECGECLGKPQSPDLRLCPARRPTPLRRLSRSSTTRTREKSRSASRYAPCNQNVCCKVAPSCLPRGDRKQPLPNVLMILAIVALRGSALKLPDASQNAERAANIRAVPRNHNLQEPALEYHHPLTTPQIRIISQL